MEIEDNELVLQAQQGNMMAFEQLVYRYDKHILSIACSYMNNVEDAKDIYQEVFLRVYRSLSQFEFRSKFSTWLHRIATNVCLTHRAKRKRNQVASLDESLETEEGSSLSLADTLPDRATTDQQTIDAEISSRVSEAMERLSPRQRMVFTLRHYEGYKLKEIASMLNCAEGTVKKYLFTATERLREQLREVYRYES